MARSAPGGAHGLPDQLSRHVPDRGRAASAGAPPAVHPIEAESFRILADRLDLTAWHPDAAAVVARVVHATADVALGRSMVVPAPAVAAGVAAVAAGAPVVCDVEMVRAGLPGLPTCCHLGEAAPGPGGTPTRSAVAAARAAACHPDGAILVCGCAPTALDTWLDLIEAGSLRPALVVGLPVGFVGAAEVKQRLAAMAGTAQVPAITNVGERGGSAAACGAVNALARLAGRRLTAAGTWSPGTPPPRSGPAPDRSPTGDSPRREPPG